MAHTRSVLMAHGLCIITSCGMVQMQRSVRDCWRLCATLSILRNVPRRGAAAAVVAVCARVVPLVFTAILYQWVQV
eukprot:scaffold2097_cov12-Tisochrysis_lutea.AAC.1